MTLAFREPTHTYALHGSPVPSVTKILAAVFPNEWQAIERWGNAEYVKERGRQVHAACAFIAQGIDFDCDPRIEGRVAACRAWFKDMRPEVVEVETPVCHPLLRYAGTPDLVAMVQGKLRLVDYKSSFSPINQLQLAAYQGCLELRGVKVDEAYPLRLGDDGYKVGKVISYKSAWRYWLNVLGEYRFREENGMIKKEDKE